MFADILQFSFIYMLVHFSFITYKFSIAFLFCMIYNQIGDEYCIYVKCRQLRDE
jgi:hypothetical protein